MRYCTACKYSTESTRDRHCPVCFSAMRSEGDTPIEGDRHYSAALRFYKPIFVIGSIVMIVALSFQFLKFIPKP